MNHPMLSLWLYRSEDCAALAELFYETVHTVNARDYTPLQLDAWATGEVDLDAWDRSFREHDTVIVNKTGVLWALAIWTRRDISTGCMSIRTARVGG